MADLARRGFTVAVPFGDNAPYDLIVDDGNGIHRVQVKYVTAQKGLIKVRVRSSGGKYNWADIDRIAVYEPEGEQCYYFGEKDIGSRVSLALRVGATANNQSQGVVWAEKYKEW